ncbi:hypothetical protein N665_0589s0010 [Sinapis alba]|nr:hypothetical protein N665_0589s0010 [Sinapis alba]
MENGRSASILLISTRHVRWTAFRYHISTVWSKQRQEKLISFMDAFSGDNCLPIYDTLKGNKKFEWSEQCQKAFQQLKHYLATPPVLAKPIEGEPMFLYIAVSATAVSGVLIREKRGEQKPNFYPKPVVELSEYDIEYREKTCTKSQVLTDFLVELPTEYMTNKEPNSTWLLHVDGSSSKQGSGIGISLMSPTRKILEQSFQLQFHASNNEAEYEALITGLQLAHGLKLLHIHTYCDSHVVASQFSGEYEARDERMDAYPNLSKNWLKILINSL